MVVEGLCLPMCPKSSISSLWNFFIFLSNDLGLKTYPSFIKPHNITHVQPIKNKNIASKQSVWLLYIVYVMVFGPVYRLLILKKF